MELCARRQTRFDFGGNPPSYAKEVRRNQQSHESVDLLGAPFRIDAISNREEPTTQFMLCPTDLEKISIFMLESGS